MREFYGLVLAVLCVWRVTHLLHAEDGPWDLMRRLRDALGGRSGSGLLDCFYCLSLWVSAPAAWWLGRDLTHGLVLWPAISAGAILIERLTSREEVATAPYFEEEVENELLRTRIEITGHDR